MYVNLDHKNMIERHANLERHEVLKGQHES